MWNFKVFNDCRWAKKFYNIIKTVVRLEFCLARILNGLSWKTVLLMFKNKKLSSAMFKNFEFSLKNYRNHNNFDLILNRLNQLFLSYKFGISMTSKKVINWNRYTYMTLVLKISPDFFIYFPSHGTTSFCIIKNPNDELTVALSINLLNPAHTLAAIRNKISIFFVACN